ncbi:MULTISPECIES: hypothetical protein [unclassified Xanthobacter]|uniref:hypothetical protein n=1 Tax=unclassified Xanthobacter TaxID=2623496 RepID=UPI001EE0EBDA|nr:MULTISPECIES: hypothetical protein [unclassified Xanthobacter]
MASGSEIGPERAAPPEMRRLLARLFRMPGGVKGFHFVGNGRQEGKTACGARNHCARARPKTFRAKVMDHRAAVQETGRTCRKSITAVRDHLFWAIKVEPAFAVLERATVVAWGGLCHSSRCRHPVGPVGEG